MSTSPRPGRRRLPPGWWTALLLSSLIAVLVLTFGLFTGAFRQFVTVTLTSPRAGLVMETGAKVKLRDVEVGRVADISTGAERVNLVLDLYPDQIQYIPANIAAEIAASTAFGAKYVDLIPPSRPSSERLAAGAVLQSRNVSPEVNTVFQNLVDLLDQIDPAKLNATLAAVAEALRGQGQPIGEAISASSRVLTALNARMDNVHEDLRDIADAGDVYTGAADDILRILDAAATTSTTIVDRQTDLDALLLNVIGFAHSATTLVGPNQGNLVRALNVLKPTADLLFKYQPEYTCLLQGAVVMLNDGGYAAAGGNGRSLVVDSGVLLGDDPYRYPENLPVIAAKGGPGGKPSCGSLPDVAKMFPVRQLITDTGWGTGLDIRPNPGIGIPGYANYFPVTRGTPEPPSIRTPGPPAPGPQVAPGVPPYGAPLNAPHGAPAVTGAGTTPEAAPDPAAPTESDAPS